MIIRLYDLTVVATFAIHCPTTHLLAFLLILPLTRPPMLGSRKEMGGVVNQVCMNYTLNS